MSKLNYECSKLIEKKLCYSKMYSINICHIFGKLDEPQSLTPGGQFGHIFIF